MKLTEEHRQILEDVFVAWAAGKPRDRTLFRIHREKQRPQIDELERADLIRRDGDHIRVTLGGVRKIQSHPVAAYTLKGITNLWPTLARAYKSQPKTKWTVEELAGLHMQAAGFCNSGELSLDLQLLLDLPGWHRQVEVGSFGQVTAVLFDEHVMDFTPDNWLQLDDQYADSLQAKQKELSQMFNKDGTNRRKSEKFKILDAPDLLSEDLKPNSWPLGTALVYLDVDHFKALNTKYLETAVDKTVLPQFQRLVADAASGHGFAYAEGGDEVVILLRNFSQTMAVAFSETLRALIEATRFAIAGETACLTVSIGLAWVAGGEGSADLQLRANAAKRKAKESGRNRVEVFDDRHAVAA